MPSRPEFFYRFCGIRSVEVFHELYAHYSRTAYRYIRIAGKVAVYLNGEKNRTEHNAKTRGICRVVENGVHILGEKIRNDYLLEKSDSHFLQSYTRVFACKFVFLTQLRNKISGSFNRSRNKLREKRYIYRKKYKVLLYRFCSAVNVYNIRQRLERVERNSDR